MCLSFYREMAGLMLQICDQPPDRPIDCRYECLAELYLEFERMFLIESSGRIDSPCGHPILIFDHHFFHLAALAVNSGERLFMAEEKPTIMATTTGFGHYLLAHGGARARNLPSAKLTMEDPDEVWIDNPKAKSAKWVYIKEYNSLPYRFTVAFLAERPEEGGIIVPVSSFPCRHNDVKKWRAGKLIYQKHVQPPEGG